MAFGITELATAINVGAQPAPKLNIFKADGEWQEIHQGQ